MNKTWYEDVKEDFVKNINDTHTLNLAISILEDRKELLEENLQLHNKIDKAIEYIETSSLEVNIKDYGILTVCNCDDVLELLKESDVDEIRRVNK